MKELFIYYSAFSCGVLTLGPSHFDVVWNALFFLFLLLLGAPLNVEPQCGEQQPSADEPIDEFAWFVSELDIGSDGERVFHFKVLENRVDAHDAADNRGGEDKELFLVDCKE